MNETTYTCKTCGAEVHQSKQGDFSKLTDGRCGSCWTVISTREYQVNNPGDVTMFSACGSGFGDKILFEVVKRNYLKDNPDETVIFLKGSDNHKRALWTHAPGKFFLNEFARDDLVEYRNTIRYNMINEVCKYAEAGDFPELTFRQKPVDVPKPFVVVHFRNIDKAPEKNVTDQEAVDVIAQLTDRFCIQVGNDKNETATDPKLCLDLTGLLSLEEIHWLCANCELFIGKDSGMVHLAAASGAKIFAWGFNGRMWFPKTAQPFTALTKQEGNITRYLNAALRGYFMFNWEK